MDSVASPGILFMPPAYQHCHRSTIGGNLKISISWKLYPCPFRVYLGKPCELSSSHQIS